MNLARVRSMFICTAGYDTIPRFSIKKYALLRSGIELAAAPVERSRAGARTSRSILNRGGRRKTETREMRMWSASRWLSALLFNDAAAAGSWRLLQHGLDVQLRELLVHPSDKMAQPC